MAMDREQAQMHDQKASAATFEAGSQAFGDWAERKGVGRDASELKGLGSGGFPDAGGYQTDPSTLHGSMDRDEATEHDSGIMRSRFAEMAAQAPIGSEGQDIEGVAADRGDRLSVEQVREDTQQSNDLEMG